MRGRSTVVLIGCILVCINVVALVVAARDGLWVLVAIDGILAAAAAVATHKYARLHYG